jgi:hypothetical protein
MNVKEMKNNISLRQNTTISGDFDVFFMVMFMVNSFVFTLGALKTKVGLCANYGWHGWRCGKTLASHRCGASRSWVRSSARVLHVS